MSNNTNSLSFSNVKTVDVYPSAVNEVNKVNANKELIDFVSTCTDKEVLTKYLEMVNNMLAKKANKSILALLGDKVLSIIGPYSVSKESLEALKNLINERIIQLSYTT